MNTEKLKKAMSFAQQRIDRGMADFGEKFPGPQSCGYVYKTDGGKAWTDTFWTGMLYLMYEYTGEKKYLELAKKNTAYMEDRLDKDVALNHHDLGFLYSLSCVADYKLTGCERSKEYGVKAAEHLIGRFQERGGFIQAWGDIGDPDSYFLIIDCLLNVPLLFWATEVTGDKKYEEIAKTHIKTALSVVVRDDFTTYHTYHFDYETGKPTYGKTAQGYSDSSCWARGQAWGVYGTALAYTYTGDESILPIYEGLTKRFIAGLPDDYVPYWDMIFTEGSEPRDTSSAAIAACGIMQMAKFKSYPDFEQMAEKMLESLIDNYTAVKLDSNIILTDAMYSRPKGHVPEASIYGDYYFVEALTRSLNKDWKMYW